MKIVTSLLPLSIIFIFTLSSCCKEECDFGDEYIYEALVYDDSCNCIVSGKVKYLEDCETVALVDYGDGTCDNIATRTVCKNGKCETSAGAYKETFEFDCQEATINGPIDTK